MPSNAKKIFPRRGDVYLVNFDPTVGAEIKKTRPALVVQNNIANQYSDIIVVAAITSRFDTELYPTEVFVPSGSGLALNSVVLLNQIRSIDKQRLIKRLGSINAETQQQVDRSLKISFGLIDL